MSLPLRPPGRSVPPSPSNTLTELASGVDALYLSGRCEPPDALLDGLAAARDSAQERDEPVEFTLDGIAFQLSPFGWQKYTYSLDHSWGRLGIRKAGRLPEVRVQARAEAIHGVSAASVAEWFDQIVTAAMGPVKWSVSRIDLFVDVQGLDLTPDLGRRFVARSKQLVTYTDGESCTGFQCGNRKSKAFFGRLYDKTADMTRNGSDWMKDSWGDRYDSTRPVQRLEFELKRDAIRQFQVSAPAEVLAAVPDMWRYCTHDWLRLCVPTGDETHSRWPLDPRWHAIQHARLRQAELGLARIKARKGAVDLERLIPFLVGYLVSFAALVGTTGVKDTLAALPHHIRSYEERTGFTFVDRVVKRVRSATFR